MFRVSVPSAAIALAVLVAPLASADPSDYQYVRTQTGAVRCVISAPHVGCERSSADGFPGAPKSQSGSGNWNIAGMDADGAFNWGEGNIGGVDADEVTLRYGQTYPSRGGRWPRRLTEPVSRTMRADTVLLSALVAFRHSEGTILPCRLHVSACPGPWLD